MTEVFMNWKLSVVRDKEVFSLIEQEKFITSWKQLAKIDNKVTVIQEPPFVITWYKQYQFEFEPLLLLGHDLVDNLVGFMPLARNRNNHFITHAGYRQGEYHGWIARTEIDEDFPVACVTAVKNLFNPRIWKWRWLPPGTSTNWLNSKSLTENHIYVKYRKQESPLWDLNNPDKLKKLLANKSTKSKINRYKKRGSFFLERVKDKEKTRQLMPLLRSQCDFRQEAVHGTTPFLSDANKADFYVERQNYPDANHFTVLWSDGKPVAFHFGACDHQTVYLGLSTFDPVEVKNSPGSLLFTELGKMLRDEGYRYFDLTPGGDEYKERYANSYQSIYLPTFYFNRTDKIMADLKEKTRKLVKKALIKLSINPEKIYRIGDYLHRIPNRLKRITLKKLFKALTRTVYEKKVYIYYRKNLKEIVPPPVDDPEVHVQRYEDLLAYTGGAGVSRSELVSRAMNRFARGEILYTITQNGVLAYYGWIAAGGQEHKLGRVDMLFHSPEGSRIIYDVYTDPRFRQQGLAKRSSRQITWDIYQSGATEIYGGVDYYNMAWRRSLESRGYVPFRAYTNKRVLFFRKKSESSYESFSKRGG